MEMNFLPKAISFSMSFNFCLTSMYYLLLLMPVKPNLIEKITLSPNLTVQRVNLLFLSFNLFPQLSNLQIGSQVDLGNLFIILFCLQIE